jgi:hypothetical protein
MQTEIKELEINGIKYVPKDSAQPALSADNYALIRSETAGVFFGYLAESNLGQGVVKLKDARRCWYWSGAASLSQLAVDGTSKPKECKFPASLPEIQIAKVIEIIPLTSKALESLKGVPVWKV